MTFLCLVVRFENWQYRLNIGINATFNEIKNRIISISGIDFSNKAYVFEIYDNVLNQYIVLTQRYLTELYKTLLTTPIQTLNTRLRSRYLEDVSSQASGQSLNYSIVWLSELIDTSHDYQSLKQKFGLTLDLDSSSSFPADELGDIDNLMLSEREPWHAALYTFDNFEESLRFVQTNAASTAIFFVTSSSLGRFITPVITDQVRAVYVLRSDVDEEINLNYSYSHLIYDRDTDLLARLARDVADYCIEQGKSRLAANQLMQAFHLFLDAEKMLIRAHIIDGKNIDDRLDNIYQQVQPVTDQVLNEHQYSKSNHLIIWLDKDVADPGAYKAFKKAFSKNTDPHNQTFTTLTDKDYDDLLRVEDAVPILFMGVHFLMQAFDNTDACLTAFDRHQDKRIFFITSGNMGRNIVPTIIERYRHVFTNPTTNGPCTSIYIVSSDFAQHIEWVIKYPEYIIIQDWDAQLLESMTRDIINYFIVRSKWFRQKHDSKEAFHQLKCATEVCYQYNKIDNDIVASPFPRSTEVDRIKKINKIIAETTVLLPYTHQHDVTKSVPEEIERSEQGLKRVQILYLHIGKNNTDEPNAGTIGNIFVGLQKMDHHILEFKNVEQCLTYIYKNQNATIGLVLSNDLDEDKISFLNRYSNVKFIFQLNSSFPWIKRDVSNDFQSSNSLIIRHLSIRHRLLHSDIGLCIASRISVEFSSQGFIEDSRLFLQYQLLMEILVRIPVTEESKNNFINWSRKHYSENSADKNAIDLFASTFRPSQAIIWYTKESFIYRILNLTFGTNDLRLIFESRYFICHLYRELKTLHKATFAILNPEICVYRGKQMSRNAFHSLKSSIGKRVITKCFLSATLDKDVATCFSGKEQATVDNVSVIFLMYIHKFTNKSKPFAWIQEISTMKDEAEFLIAPGVIFQNRDIHEIEENVFEVALAHTLEEEELQEEINRSTAVYLERAQNITSVVDFESLIADASHEINEQEILSPSDIDDEQKNVPPIVSQPVPTIEPEIIQQVKERLSKTHFSSLQTSLPASKYLYADMKRLRLSNTRSDGSTLFIVDQTPFDDIEENNGLLPSNIIICRIFPSSNIYKQCAYKIQMTLPSSYPFTPPEMCFLTPIYHPNVSQDGKVCMDILQRTSLWTMRTSLTSVLIAVVDLIDNPNIDAAVNFNIAKEYVENRAEFNRKTLRMMTKYGLLPAAGQPKTFRRSNKNFHYDTKDLCG